MTTHLFRFPFCQWNTRRLLNYANIKMSGASPLLYHSVDSILNDFNKDENKDAPGVKELLEIYEIAKSNCEKFKAVGEMKKNPLIVLEGLDGSGKTTVGKRFSKKIGAFQLKTPPESISHIRHLFDDHQILRTAYYSLGNYIAALEVQLLLSKSPILMDRYWHSTAAYAIAQAVQDHPSAYTMPPKNDIIYKWPTDLFKPDAVLFLNVSEEVRKERQSRRRVITNQEDLLNSNLEFRKNVIQAYENMYEPGIITVNGDLSFGPVLGQLQKITKYLF